MPNIWTAIPYYNNPETILQVVDGCLRYTLSLLVVDDGSSVYPPNFEQELARCQVKLLRHPTNSGKGEAILTALRFAQEQKADYLVCLDADGQHLPEDLPAFFSAIASAKTESIFIGCRDFQCDNVPGSSRFGRRFSNFWVRLETGVHCEDTQSGFRAYPVRAALQLSYLTRRYNFEIEILVRLLWGGVKLQELPVQVRYEPPSRRISHFRPFMDNLRLSLLHTLLVGWNLLPIPRKRVVQNEHGFQLSLLKHPVAFLKYLLTESSTPTELARSAAVGTFLAVLPIFGFHTIAILYFCVRLRLNKVMAVAIQNLYAPPFSPFLCIELGSLIRRGHLLWGIAPAELVRQAPLLLLEWLLGSLVLGPLFATVNYVLVRWMANRLATRRVAHA